MAATEAAPPPAAAAAPAAAPSAPADMEAFFRQAKYPLIKYTDMSAEMREEAMDVCITAVEKYPSEVEKCTQVGGCMGPAWARMVPHGGHARAYHVRRPHGAPAAPRT